MTLAELKMASDDATNAYFRAKPGGRRGWKRPSNSERLSRLHAAMVAANAAYLDALRVAIVARREREATEAS